MIKKGQVWVETVLYTLIILALIGLVLAFVSPRIQEEQDKIVIEQTIESLNLIDSKINAILEGGPNNKRIVEFGIKRGELIINSSNDKIIFILRDLNEPYSEPGVEINFGRIKILSVEGKKDNSVYLSLDYRTLANLTFEGDDLLDKKINPAAVPYQFTIENKGRGNSLFEVVDIGLVS